jgi:hypothetical protein
VATGLHKGRSTIKLSRTHARTSSFSGKLDDWNERRNNKITIEHFVGLIDTPEITE